MQVYILPECPTAFRSQATIMASEDIKDISKMERHVDDKSSDDSVPIPVFDSEMERKIVRKIDVRLIPILLILFLVSFVDRSNIGNAKIQGLEKSLGMKGNQFNIAVFVFNIPCNNTWLSRIAVW